MAIVYFGKHYAIDLTISMEYGYDIDKITDEILDRIADIEGVDTVGLSIRREWEFEKGTEDNATDGFRTNLNY